jgi:hypothetical protein
VTTRSIWNLIRQDEALFHCEWEDIAFGLDGQCAGIPHRVLPGLVAESTVPHPLLLTRLHEVSDDGGPVRGKWHVDPEHEAAARAGTARFKPVVALTRTDYYARAAGCFHRLVPGAERLTDAELRACSGLADFWRLVAARVSTLPLARRTDVVAVCHVLSEVVYKWPNCQVLSWVRAFERARASHLLDGFATVVGWGAGSLFRATHARVPRALAYTIDSNPAAWDTVVDGVPVSAPHRLDGEDPSRTALVVFSCAFDEIAAAIARRGPFAVYRTQDVVSVPGFQPLADIVAYFDEVERHYPVVFAPPALEGAQLSCPQ